MTQKRQHDAVHEHEDKSGSVSTDSAGRVHDTKGDVGFRGGQRPDARAKIDSESPERARPRDTGRQDS
jgi:hypothetical protein